VKGELLGLVAPNEVSEEDTCGLIGPVIPYLIELEQITRDLRNKRPLLPSGCETRLNKRLMAESPINIWSMRL